MKRGAIIGLAAGAAALVVAAGAAWWFLGRPAGPDAAAQAYLDALAAGDAAGAIELLAASPGDDAETAFAGAETYLAEPAVIATTEDDRGGATVDVRFTLDGDEVMSSFDLTLDADGWRVDADGVGTLRADATLGDSVIVGGVLQPSSESAPLLPAVYPVTAAPRGIVDGSTSAIIVPGAAIDLAIEASLSADATALAQTRLDGYADGCAAPASAVPDNCGLRVPWAADLATLDAIAFRIEAHPIITLSPDATAFDAVGGEIVATATGTTRAGSTASFTYRADDWALRGSVLLTGDEMVLSVR
ncbi:hypothetical protein GCM10022200_09110 [Microbacterium awajiense]|uniref:NTF2-like N-terminal transpeptidase domain-containing protein n=1 Tax=Microbacterium awajiense TaxID=415214 RepID=A0ABP7AB81_9MICO